MFDLQYKAPARDLIEYVSAFYLFRMDEPAFADVERADIGQFRFIFEGTSTVNFGGYEETFCRDALFGPRSRATRISATGPSVMFGFGVQPAGWVALTGGVAADALAEHIVDASLHAPALVDGMRTALRAEHGIDAMVSIAEPLIRSAVQSGPLCPYWFVAAVDEWLQQHLLPRFDDLVVKTGLSRRKTDRMIRDLYGASPNLLIRKYRALRVANMMANGESDWHDYVGEAFYDQSHCIRELKYFTGMTPDAVKHARSRLSSLTFSRRRLAGSVSQLAAET